MMEMENIDQTMCIITIIRVIEAIICENYRKGLRINKKETKNKGQTSLSLTGVQTISRVATVLIEVRDESVSGRRRTPRATDAHTPSFSARYSGQGPPPGVAAVLIVRQVVDDSLCLQGSGKATPTTLEGRYEAKRPRRLPISSFFLSFRFTSSRL